MSKIEEDNCGNSWQDTQVYKIVRSPAECKTQPPEESIGQPPKEGIGQPPKVGIGELPKEDIGQPLKEGMGQSHKEVIGQPITQPPKEGIEESHKEGKEHSPKEGEERTPEKSITHSPKEGKGQSHKEGKTQSPKEDTIQPKEGITQPPKEGLGPLGQSPKEDTIQPKEGITQPPKEGLGPLGQSPKEDTIQPKEGITQPPKEGLGPLGQSPKEDTIQPKEGITQPPKEGLGSLGQSPKEDTIQPKEGITQPPKECKGQSPKEDITQPPKEGLGQSHKEGITQPPKEDITQPPKEGLGPLGQSPKEDTIQPKEDITQPLKEGNESNGDELPDSPYKKLRVLVHEYEKKITQDNFEKSQSLPIISHIEPNNPRCLKINFFTLVLKDLWDNTDAICLRIGTKHFHDFTKYYCQFQFLSEAGINQCEYVLISGILSLPLRIVENKKLEFPYRYFFYMKDGSGIYEDLYHYQKKNTFNRHLILRFNHIKGELVDMIKRFDILLLPEQMKKEESPLSQLWNFLTLKKDETILNLKIEDRRFVSLNAFLPEFMGFGHFPDSSNCGCLDDFVKIFSELVENLVDMNISEEPGAMSRMWDHIKEFRNKGKTQLVHDWLLSLFVENTSYDLNDQLIRIYLTLILMFKWELSSKDIISKVIHSIEGIFENVLKKKQISLEFIKDQSILNRAFCSFIFTNIYHTNFEDKYFLLLTLYHCLFDFAQIQLNRLLKCEYFSKEYWGYPDGVQIMKATNLSITAIRQAFDLARHDPVISYSIVYNSLSNSTLHVFAEIHDLSPQILPLSAFLGFLLLRMESPNYFQDNILESILSLIIDKLSKEKASPGDNERFFKLTFLFLKKILKYTFSRDIFELILSMCAYQCSFAEKIAHVEIPEQAIPQIFEFVKNWHHQNVNFLFTNEKSLEHEILFWNKVISFPFPLTLEWHSLVRSFLSQRLRDICSKELHIFTHLFIYVHNHNEISDYIQDSFRIEMSLRLKKADSRMQNNIVNKLKGLNPDKLKKISNIFSSFLLEVREDFLTAPLRHCLEWPSWGNYFEFNAKHQIYINMSEKSKTLLDTAFLMFSQWISSLCNHEINISDFLFIDKRSEVFFSLSKKILKYSNKYDFEEISDAYKGCEAAVDWVQQQLKQLKNILLLLKSINGVDCREIEEFLSINPIDMSLSDIVEMIDENFQFRNVHELNLIINSNVFNTISICAEYFQFSDIFKDIFEQQIYLLRQSDLPQISLCSQAWNPTIKILQSLVDSFVDESILLSNVHKCFHVKKDNNSISRELTYLSHGCTKALLNSISDFPDISICSNKIARYFNFYNCAESAAKILELKEAFSLGSDFSLIKSLQEFSVEFKDKPLSAINEELCYIAKSLQNFTDEDRVVLNEILKNMKFVIWVRENMNDLNDLKTFVEIALTTSSGDRSETDRIMILHSVCTNLSPLLFNVDKQTTYDYLIERCKEVFSVVRTNEELLGLLGYVSENISFWEELKKSQGSLEEGALIQLEKIVSSGLCTVSTASSLPEKMISLTVGTDRDATKTYNLEQLKDLRSKLMLVIGKSNVISECDSKFNAVSFNHLFDLILEIANIFSALVEIGNMRYFDYSFSFTFQDIDMVEGKIKETRTVLKECRVKMEEAREKCYFLNYFTNAQLVSLQKGLKAFIDANSENEEQLYHLLGLLNSEVRAEDIHSALQKEEIINNQQSTQISYFRPAPIISRVNPSQYSCLSVLNRPTSTFHQAMKSTFSVVDETDKMEFPVSFSDTDKSIAKSVSLDCGFPLHLAIKGVEWILNTTGIMSEEALTRWCIEYVVDTNEAEHSDSDSDELCPQKDENDSSSDIVTPQETPTIPSESIQCELEYIDILKLGKFLKEIYHAGTTKIRGERLFPEIFRIREPNLIFVPMDLLYESVLFLYGMSPQLQLPYYSEVLLCSDQTTLEEVDLFWRRVIFKSEHNHWYLHCLVGIENLEYEVAVQSVDKLRQYLQLGGTSQFKLVIVCSEEREEESYMAAALENYKKPNHISNSPLTDINTKYLWEKFCSNLYSDNRYPACMVDKDRSRVRLVMSESVGAGKSLYVSNLVSDMLTQGVVSEEEREEADVTVAIHGKQASEDQLTRELLRRRVSCVEHGHLFHVDVASTVQLGLEPILFKLLILGGICRRTGELWHCRRKDYYVVECTVNQTALRLFNFTKLFPTIHCIQPILALNTIGSNKSRLQALNLQELNREEFQRTFEYLKQLEIGSNLDVYTFNPDQLSLINPLEKLQLFLKHCGIKQPSWAEIRNFVTFLSKQLSDCDNSDYCRPVVMGEEWKGFKSFVIKFLLHMSRDFATPSLQPSFNSVSHDILDVYEIIERRKWENSSHPYIFFNPDRHSMTFLGFQISNNGHLLDSDNPSLIIEESILPRALLKILTLNHANMNENFHLLEKREKIAKIAKVMDLDWLADPDPGYVLTLDNVRKMLAILMRFRCNIPVVIMGETGCGKTRLIQFMCALQALQTGAKNMLILKVHGGTTEKDVMNKVEEAELLAEQNTQLNNESNSLKIDTVLFFDEANTSPAIGLIKEIMCDRRMYGRKIRTDIRLQFIAACNPYRKHSVEMLEKLSCAGLGFFTEASRTTDRLGDIPLRELVYRVMELPASMRPLVWDFGQLSDAIERTYTREIVAKHLTDRNSPIDARDGVVDVITEVLSSAQNYMRERKDECSFVSLRDVERAMKVLLWFYSNLQFFKPESPEVIIEVETEFDESIGLSPPKHLEHSNQPLSQSLLSHSPERTMKQIYYSPPRPPRPPPRRPINPIPTDQQPAELLRSPPRRQLVLSPDNPRSLSPPKSPRPRQNIHGIDFITYSLIISLAVCYRARLQTRDKFDKLISTCFRKPLSPLRDPSLIHFEVDRCQQLILDQMDIDEHIAKNKALKENVFMMFVCIELKIPLFVIGKPGSSKSLAKSIISNNMQGNKCPDKSVLRNFKQVHIMSYQCSQLSTAEGIIGVFRNCRNMQKKTGSSKFVSCVVLDEVGLAEDSPLLPLKVLHPLLEDSNYGTDEVESKVNDEETKFSVINPKASLTVNQSGKDETEEDNGNESVDRVAFIGISNWSLDPAKMNRGIMVARGDPDIEELKSSAEEICHSKSIDQDIIRSIDCWIPKLAEAYIELVNERSFLAKSFRKDTKQGSREYYGLRDFYSLVKMLVFICNQYKTVLTRSILKHCVLRNFGGASDNRPLAIFQGKIDIPPDRDVGLDCSPLSLIHANLASFSTSFHGETRYLLLLTENYAALNILLSNKQWLQHDYRVIFGSYFPKDQEYSTICRNINKIKICMESGKTIILLNLENLYESLYDALNQYYMRIYNQRYVDLGLGTHRMKCRVHEDFKLIVIADTETVYKTFPTPLINRLEKHFLTMSTVLSEEGVILSEQLTKWAKDFSTLDRTHSIGFQKRCDFSVGDCFIGYHTDTPSSIVFHVMKAMYPEETADYTELDREAVLERSQITLLRMATTDAVLRVKNSFLRIQSDSITTEYFRLHLGSLEEYLRQALGNIYDNDTRKHLTLATTHSRLLTDRDVNQLKERLKEETNEIKCLSLQQFQSEQQFSSEIQRFLKGNSESKKRTGPGKRVLLVQCDKGVENAKLIACARHKTVEELSDWREERVNEDGVCLVFLVQLRREAHGSRFESFCGGDWNTVHIDDIRSLDYKELPPISELIGKQIHQMFGGYEDIQDSDPDFCSYTFCQRTKIKSCIQSAVSTLVDQNGSEERTLKRMHQFIQLLERDTFFKALSERLVVLLQQYYEQSSETDCDWLQLTANCGEDIQSSGTFRKAVNLRINRTITPLLAELIALLDRNGNLELGLLCEDVPPCIHDLWQAIFQDERLLVLTYNDIISSTTLKPRVRVPVLSDGAGGKFYQSHFPFSFFILNFVIQLWKKFKAHFTTTSTWNDFESLFDQTPLGQLINHVMDEKADFHHMLNYLLDFIHMSVFPRFQDEFNVFESVILTCIDEYDSNNKVNEELIPNTTNITIPKIQCAFEKSKNFLELLARAFLLEPSLANTIFKRIKHLKEANDPRLYRLEHIFLEEIISLCSHKKELTSSKYLAERYVIRIRQLQPLVEQGLSLNESEDITYIEAKYKLKANWGRIIAVQLFVSHCCIGVGLDATSSSINILYMILNKTPDFTSVGTIRDVIKVLSKCLKDIPAGQRSGILRRNKFRECATKFFISILINLTFKNLPEGEPNAELINLLMKFVTLDEQNLTDMLRYEGGSISMFKKNNLNPSLSFKTFLLQLMIKHRRDVFKKILSSYLSRFPAIEDNVSKREFYMLIVQSIEDSEHQKFQQQNSEDQCDLLFSLIRRFPNPSLLIHNHISYELLDNIATLRFICIHVSYWIVECYRPIQSTSITEVDNTIKRGRERVISNFRDLCLLHEFEDLHVFLLKNVYHQLGSEIINLKSDIRNFSWILPDHVKEKIDESRTLLPDYFAIYGEDYLRIKYAVEQAIVSGDKSSLLQYFREDADNAQEIKMNVDYLLYSLFQSVIESAKEADCTPQSQDFQCIREMFNTDLKNVKNEILVIGFQILSNNFCNTTISSLKFSPASEQNQIYIARIIYHMAIMLSSKAYPELFTPIFQIYETPHLLNDALFPTMMDDNFLSAKAALTQEGRGSWYSCPNGHAYFVGECGQPIQAQACPDCGIWVGGKSHRVTQKSSLLNATTDSTKPGYILASAGQRKMVPSSERSLSPASVVVIRSLMHGTFIWSSCSNRSTETNTVLSSLVHPDTPTDLPNFFYQHLDRDVRELAGLTGKNFEEACLIIHLIIQSLMQSEGQQCIIPTQLTERKLRDEWEKEFDKRFVQPALTSLDTLVQRQMEQILNEKRISNNPLLRIVYERDEPEPDDQVPHLWRYRTIVSLGQFSQSFSTADLEKKNKCPIIDKFLKEERSLYVTRYLPDIVQLQQRVGEKFLHRLDRREAASTTIGDFLKRLRQENREEADEFGKLIESLGVAWSLIGEEVKVKGRLRMEEFLEQHITPATPLAYLLPSTRGEGLLITSLTDYLLLVHNSFVHAYRDIVKGSSSDKVPLREVTSCHMIEFEDQIQPLLLSHAHYSLALGQGTQISYDFEGVEKQLMEQLIQSKPLIAAEHLRFEYSREAYNLGVFEQVRHKVQQAEIKEAVWRAIREELESLEAMSDVLRVLDVVIRFLSSTGGDPEQRLTCYLHEVLKYPPTSNDVGSLLQSKKAEGLIHLKHILSFLRLISVEKARKLSILGQIPFSSLREEFSEEVSEEETQQLEHSCNHYTVEKVLVFLHEFILIFVRDRDIGEKDFSIKDSLEAYAEENKWKLPDGFSTHFPDTIKLSKCAGAWAVLARQEHRISSPTH